MRKEQCQCSKGGLQIVELRWSRLCWQGQPCHSLPLWQGAEEPFFSENCTCLLIPDVSVGYSAGRACIWACWDKAAGSCLTFHPSMPPPGNEMVWGAKEGSQVRHCLPEKPDQWAELVLWSREEVRLSCCLGSGVVSFHGRSGAGVGHYCPAFEVNQRKEWGVKILPQEWLREGAFCFPLPLRPLCFAVPRLWLGEAEGTAGQGAAVLCCSVLPFPVLRGPAICGAVLWNRIRKWSDQALQK